MLAWHRMKTFTFATQSGQQVTILASVVIGMRHMSDETFGPRTAIDTAQGAIYTITETKEEYQSRVSAWLET